VAKTRTRLYAFVHIANIGLTPFPISELPIIEYADVDAAAKTVAANAGMVIGIRFACRRTLSISSDLNRCEGQSAPARMLAPAVE
jgi:predicted amidohydrolase